MTYSGLSRSTTITSDPDCTSASPDKTVGIWTRDDLRCGGCGKQRPVFSRRHMVIASITFK
jgi:hypothetical protein